MDLTEVGEVMSWSGPPEAVDFVLCFGGGPLRSVTPNRRMLAVCAPCSTLPGEVEEVEIDR